MAKIKTLKNWNEDHTKRVPIAPRTHVKAVFDDNGNTLDSLMAVQDEKLTELGSEVEIGFGTKIYHYEANVPYIINGFFAQGETVVFETSESNTIATTLGGYVEGGGSEDIVVALPQGKNKKIILEKNYIKLYLFSSKSGTARLYKEDSVKGEIDSIYNKIKNTEDTLNAKIDEKTEVVEDLSNEFISGYWNLNDGVGNIAYFTESSTLFTLVSEISKGQKYISNSMVQTNMTVSHAFLDDNNVIIAYISTTQINNGVEITEDVIQSGATKIVLVYRSTLQTEPISCKVLDNINGVIDRLKKDTLIDREVLSSKKHFVSRTNDKISVYTKGYAEGEDLCLRLMNNNINKTWDFFDWQRIPNNKDIVASSFEGHILINGGTGTDYISAYTVAAKNNADGDSQTVNPTGGWHGYNSLVSNVTPTARNISVKVLADGKSVGINEGVYCDNITMIFVNRIQGWNTQKEDGSGREILQQRVVVLFSGFDCNVEIETIPLEDVQLIKHYGLNIQNNMNSSNVSVNFVGDVSTINPTNNGQSEDKESRCLKFTGDNDVFSLKIENFGEGTFKHNALDHSGIYIGSTKKGYFGCIYRNAEKTEDWLDLIKGSRLYLKGSYNCQSI